MLREDLCLFAKDVLGLEIGPHIVAWGDLVDREARLAVNAARDHSKSTFFSYAYPIWRVWGEPGCEVYIFSKTLEQAAEFLDIILYGRNNLKGIVDIPGLEGLMPSRDAMKVDPSLRLNKADVKFTNGSRIRVAGYGKAMRGRHPKYVVLDDPLNDEDMWSETTRMKNIEYFKSAITNMVMPEGQLIVVGCVGEDTWVPTERGLQRIEALRPGPRVPQKLHDLSLGVEGKDGPSTTTKFWDNGFCLTKKITLKTGHHLEGSHRHPLWHMPETGVPDWRRSDELTPGDWVALRLGTESWGEAPESLDKDTAYLMGLWCAEGCAEPPYRLTIASSVDPSIHDFLSSRTEPEKWIPHRGGTHWRCSRKAVLDQWEDWGVKWVRCYDKRIPDTIMSGSRENAIAWIQGYMDGDGTSYVKGNQAQVYAGTTSRGLADDLQILFGNLGVLLRIHSKDSPPTERAKNGGRTIYIARATGEDAKRAMPWCFRLKRKSKKTVASARVKGDRVPHQGPLVRLAMSTKPRRKRSPDGQAKGPPPFNASGASTSSTLCRSLMVEVADWYQAEGSDPDVCQQLRANASDGLRWVQVESIEDGKAYTVDFVVPGDHSFISNGIVSHNTPYHASDLYGFLRKNPVYTFIRFPGIIKDPATGKERALFPWRWSLEKLRSKKKEIGSVSFAREILCQPISDDLSIFPGYLFPPCYAEHLTMRMPLAQIQANGWVCYMGVDIARSSSVGADYFVIFVIARSNTGEHIIMDIRRSRGLPFQQQLQEIEIAAALYDPSIILIESNAMQQIYTDEMRRLTDLPVKPFLTLATNKYPLDRGVPGLRILLEGQKVVIPKGDEISLKLSGIWEDECTQFGFIDGKLQGIGEHDDTVMSWWFAVEAAKMGGFSFSFGDEDGDEDDPFGDGEEGEDWKDVFLGDDAEKEAEGFTL